MFSLFLHEFFQGTLVSSHSIRTCIWGEGKLASQDWMNDGWKPKSHKSYKITCNKLYFRPETFKQTNAPSHLLAYLFFKTLCLQENV